MEPMKFNDFVFAVHRLKKGCKCGEVSKYLYNRMKGAGWSTHADIPEERRQPLIDAITNCPCTEEKQCEPLIH